MKRAVDTEKALAAVRQDGLALQYASEELRGDREIVLAAVAQNGLALQWASEELQGDPEVVLAALRSAQQQGAKEFSSVLEYISNSTGAATLRNQNQELFLFLITNLLLDSQLLLEEEKKSIDLHIKNFVENSIFTNQEATILEAVQQDGLALRFASDELRGDRGVVLAAVQKDGLALRWASEELQGDRKIVLTAVQKDGGALKYASKKLQGDRELVLAAVKQDGDALRFASDELRGDRELVLAAVKQDGDALEHASDELRADREVVLTAMQQYGGALEYANRELRGDRELVLAAVRQNGGALKWASDELRGDREFVLAAVGQNGEALRCASRELQQDPEIKLKALLSQYRKAENDQEKQRFRANIINLVVENLDDRRLDGKPTNIISCIDFAQFGDIRRDPEIIKAILRNYTTQPEIDFNLELAIAGAGGNFNLTEYCRQMKTAEWRLQLTYASSMRLVEFINSKIPDPDVASASADGVQQRQGCTSQA